MSFVREKTHGLNKNGDSISIKEGESKKFYNSQGQDDCDQKKRKL